MESITQLPSASEQANALKGHSAMVVKFAYTKSVLFLSRFSSVAYMHVAGKRHPAAPPTR